LIEKEGITEDRIHAYVDGWLSAAEAAEVAEGLARDPDAAKRVEDYRRINSALRALHADALEEPVPDRLLAATSQATATVPAYRPLRIAAAIAFLAVGGLVGWTAKGLWMPASPAFTAVLARDAHSAHLAYVSESRHPVEVPGSDSAHLAHWVSARLGQEIPLPALDEFGLTLLGGRIVPAGDRVAALFMYADPGGKRMTLYVRARPDARGDVDFTWSQAAGVGTWSWAEEHLACALTGALPKDRMLEISRRVLEIVYPEAGGRRA